RSTPRASAISTARACSSSRRSPTPHVISYARSDMNSRRRAACSSEGARRSSSFRVGTWPARIRARTDMPLGTEGGGGARAGGGGGGGAEAWCERTVEPRGCLGASSCILFEAGLAQELMLHVQRLLIAPSALRPPPSALRPPPSALHAPSPPGAPHLPRRPARGGVCGRGRCAGVAMARAAE